MMNDPDPEILRSAFFEVIENQIQNRTPPEIKGTYDRLKVEGYSEEGAMKLIGCPFSAVACYRGWIKSWGSTTEPPVRKPLDMKKDKVYSPLQNLFEDVRLPRASVR